MSQKLARNFSEYSHSLIVSLFLMLGLLKSASFVDLLTYFIFGLYAVLLLHKHTNQRQTFSKICFFLLIMSAIFILVSQKIHYWLPIIFVIILGTIYGKSFHRVFAKYKTLLLLHIVLVFLITSFVNSQELRKTLRIEPKTRAYFSDHMAFLRKYYLVNKGYDYYSSVIITELEDGRASQIPPKYWNWRLPYINYFWKYLPGNDAISIYIAFIILSSSLLLVSYLIGTLWLNSKNAAIIPYLLFPYLHFAARNISFLDPEIWSMLFFTLGLYFLIKKNQYASFILITFSLMTRELYLIPAILLIVFAYLTKNLKQLIILMFSVLFSLVALFVHYFRVSAFLPLDIKLMLPNSHNLDFYVLQQTFSYYSWEYLMVNFRPFLIIFLIFVLSTLLIIIREKIKYDLLMLILPPLVLIFLTLKNGTKDGDYWGVTFIPIIMITSVITSFRVYKIWKR